MNKTYRANKFRVHDWVITRNFDGRWEAWDTGGIAMYFTTEADAVMFATLAGPAYRWKNADLRDLIYECFAFNEKTETWGYCPLC